MGRQRRKREAVFVVGDKNNTGGKRSKRGRSRTGREEEPKG